MADNSNEFFKGFLLGGAIGAFIALLYAPKSGREMREDIKRKTEDLLKEAEIELERAQKKAEEIISKGKAKADALRSEAETKANEVGEKTKSKK